MTRDVLPVTGVTGWTFVTLGAMDVVGDGTAVTLVVIVAAGFVGVAVVVAFVGEGIVVGVAFLVGWAVGCLVGAFVGCGVAVGPALGETEGCVNCPPSA